MVKNTKPLSYEEQSKLFTTIDRNPPIYSYFLFSYILLYILIKK
nr:MAG TPA: hypothetical protein [Caudoviricetes sp.]